MKSLYFDCAMGATGELLDASLLELFDDRTQILATINEKIAPFAVIQANNIVTAGINGTTITVDVNPEERNHHVHLSEIYDLVQSLDFEEHILEQTCEVISLITDAQARLSQSDAHELAFNKAAILYTIAESVSAFYMIAQLAPSHIFSSAIATGYGVQGHFPVPAPVTAYILTDVPIQSGRIEGELTSFTGAAILKACVEDYGPMPLTIVKRIGYGIRDKDGEIYTCLRSLFGEIVNQEDSIMISAHIENMTDDSIGVMMKSLYDHGAKAISTYTTQETQPYFTIRVVGKEKIKDHLIEDLFSHSLTNTVYENKAYIRIAHHRADLLLDHTAPLHNRKKTI